MGGLVRSLSLVYPYALCVFAVAGCKNKIDRAVPSAEAATAKPVVDAGVTMTQDAGSAVATCPAPDPAKIAPFVADSKAITTEIPKIEDPTGSLASFEDKLLAEARGVRKDPVRIGFYGDSNLTSDFMTAHLRRQLQGRFGDAGHGFVAFARPWAWYTHENVHHYGTWPMWRQFDCTTDPVVGHRYGFANMTAESSKPGAAAWAGTADADSPVGTKVSRFDVYFMKQPHGGTFDLLLDGKAYKTISTTSSDFEPGFERIDVPDGAHEVKAVVKGDYNVRLFGTTLERDDPGGGVVVDSLGAGALNFQRFMLTEPVMRKAQLQRRQYDVVFIWLGMNSMWLEPNKGWATDTVKTIREALPDVPIVLVTPPDSEKTGASKTDPRIIAIIKQLHDISLDQNTAFWDLRAAMGGDGSFLEFIKRGLGATDRVHLSREGNIILGQRLLSALFDDVNARLAAHPDAGCPK